MTRSVAEAAEISLRMIREAKELSYDTETSGLDWKRNFPVGYVIGDGAAEVVYVPVRHGGGGNLPDAKVKVPKTPTDSLVVHKYEKALAKAFAHRRTLPKEQGLIVGHHLKFDLHFSARAGIMLGRNLTCTQVNEALLDEYARSFSLDSCAERHGVTAKKGEELYQHLADMFGGPATRDSMQFFWQTAGDDDIAVDYAVGDGVSTYELFDSQRQMLLEQGLGRIWDIESRLLWTLFRMEHRGIKVDEEYLHSLVPIIAARVREAEAALPKDFNVRSGPQMKKYIEATGHTNWPSTELGNPSFTEKFLKSFPEGRNIVTVRKWSNLANTFVTPLIEQHVFEGRIHANINQLKADDFGTISGRFSVSAPNTTQLPKRDKEVAKLFRKVFVADEEMEFWEADYSQAEPRLFTHYSREPALVKGYGEPPFKDMHQVVADLMGVERDPTGKRMNQGILTGMYPKTFAAHMGWSIQEATEKWNRWFELFPGIRGFQDQAKAVILDRGYVHTILGRRCRLDHPRFSYKATSKIIQGGGADILKYKLLELDEKCEAEGDVVNMLGTVHDAFDWQAPKGAVGEAAATDMLSAMIDVQGPPFNLRVPFVVEHDHGSNWAEATFGPEETWDA